MLNGFLEHWKTTSCGIATILVAIADVIHPAGGGNPNFGGDIATIMAGLGLIFGKDWNK